AATRCSRSPECEKTLLPRFPRGRFPRRPPAWTQFPQAFPPPATLQRRRRLFFLSFLIPCRPSRGGTRGTTVASRKSDGTTHLPPPPSADRPPKPLPIKMAGRRGDLATSRTSTHCGRPDAPGKRRRPEEPGSVGNTPHGRPSQAGRLAARRCP